MLDEESDSSDHEHGAVPSGVAIAALQTEMGLDEEDDLESEEEMEGTMFSPVIPSA